MSVFRWFNRNSKLDIYAVTIKIYMTENRQVINRRFYGLF